MFQTYVLPYLLPHKHDVRTISVPLFCPALAVKKAIQSKSDIDMLNEVSQELTLAKSHFYLHIMNDAKRNIVN